MTENVVILQAHRWNASNEETMTGKLKLNPEAFGLTSFQTEIEAAGVRGTVEGHAINCANTDLRSCPFTIRTCASYEFSGRQADEI